MALTLPTGKDYDVDWVYSPDSNCCVTNNLEWFQGAYKPFKTHYFLNDESEETAIKVEGVGRIHLPVRTTVKKGGGSKLELKDVLYAPNAICNIIGSSIGDYTYEPRPGSKFEGGMLVKDRKCAALVEKHKLQKLLLGYQLPGTTSLDKFEDGSKMDAIWPDSERQRWEAYKAFINQPPMTPQKKSKMMSRLHLTGSPSPLMSPSPLKLDAPTDGTKRTPKRKKRERTDSMNSVFGGPLTPPPQQKGDSIVEDAATPPSNVAGESILGEQATASPQAEFDSIFGGRAKSPSKRAASGFFGEKPKTPTKQGIYTIKPPKFNIPTEVGSSNATKNTKVQVQTSDDAPYTAAERRWLRKNKKLVREMMESANQAAVEQFKCTGEDSDHEVRSGLAEDLSENPFSHLADCHFKPEQLDWIKKHHRHSFNFMHAYSLKPYDVEDCEEAVDLVKVLMSEG